EVLKPALHTTDALEVVVVEHNELAVCGYVHVQLYAVADACGVFKGRDGVFRHAFIYAVQTAMREIAAHERLALLVVAPAGGDKKGSGECGRGQRSAGYEPGFRVFVQIHRETPPHIYVSILHAKSVLVK